ncbi:cytochrome c-type biogenesis protein CcmF [Dongia mobilis]|uniref:Cytochrome c-type biogenesis protein CcmF n=1 Tax=Dongia mobilis TaxID=578943 RepID=A0A4R6WVN2_9PROT|nr:heme lyase CcmF/NrfE family subunit [Dongia mobilis]TDQ83142.1 cytochrome c-type biogenesis protein CcmF [Dongia mobilis]
MIIEIGHFALVLALVLALAQAILPLVGAQRGIRSWMLLAKPAAIGQFAFLLVAFLALVHAFVVSDFSVVIVYLNSHSSMPLLYKISGTWGNHEGSLLLWVTILAFFGALVAVFGENLPPRLKARTLSVQAMISIAFILFTLFTSNPFARISPAPFEGEELNPLLQDPGLAFHPPMLYIGYVGFSIAFSFAVAALIEGKVDAAWARWVRPWTLLSWTSLTGGIALGAHWAYYELGWGGWWFWDPVENASFMPWLMGTALLHSAIVVEKRDALKAWTLLLAILTFGCSLLGTFLVRSGVITSVHAFAQDPERGVFILAILGVALGGALTLFAWRAPVLKPGGMFAPVSREAALMLNNLFITTLTFVVLLGTLLPLIFDVLGLQDISVGPPYYKWTFIPISLPLILLAAVGPLLGWKRGDLSGALQRLWGAGILGVAGIVVAAWIDFGSEVMAALGIGVGLWLLAGTFVEWAERVRLFRTEFTESWRRMRHLPRAAYGMTLAHAGLAIAIIGMTASAAWKEEVVRQMRPGETIEIGGFTYRLEEVRGVRGPNYIAEQADFTVLKDGEFYTRLYPERRQYMVQPMPTTEAAIESHFFGDLYAVIGESDGAGAWTVRIYEEPLVPWIWTGAIVMVLGGFVSMSDRRYRVGAPSRQPAAQPAKA